MPSSLYQQMNPMKLPNGITMEELRNPKQAVLKRFGNFSNPYQAVQNMLTKGQISQGQVNMAMQMARQHGLIK